MGEGVELRLRLKGAVCSLSCYVAVIAQGKRVLASNTGP
jgi:hypothetical protein